MAIFELQGPDGKVYEVEAPSAEAAVGAFQQFKPQAPAQPQALSWSDVPGQALKNAPQSAVNLGKAIVQPFTDPVGTATGLGRLLGGVGSKIVGAADTVSEAVGGPDLQTPEQKAQAEAPLNAVGQFYKDRYGSIEGLKKTLATDPVGAAADAATVLYGGGALAPGRVGSAVTKAGATVDPIRATGRAIKGAANVAGRRAADALGVTTGAGSTPIKSAFKAGTQNNAAFVDQMRGNAPMDDVVSMAERGVDKFVQKRSADYQANNPLGTIGNRPAGAMQPLDTKPIWDKITSSSGMARFQGVTYNADAADVLQKLSDMVEAFEKAPDGKSAVALDKMKQGVYQIARKEPPGSPSHKIAMGVYNEIGKQIRQQVPAYDKVMKDYGQASDLINEMRRTLSINDKATTDTTMRKLQSVMRNNVNTNYGSRQKLVDQLSTVEPDLPMALAGQALNDYAPRGLSRIAAGGAGVAGLATMNPSTLAMLPLASPRIVGEAAYAAGRGVGAAKNAAARSPVSADDMARALMLAQLLGNTSQQP